MTAAFVAARRCGRSYNMGVRQAIGARAAVHRMRIEAFSEGKSLDEPEANEDRFVVLPGRGYAVIDGATDIGGRRYDGHRGGWWGGETAMRAVASFLGSATPRELRAEALVLHVGAEFRALYARLGILDAMRAEPARRFGATLTLAADLGDTFRFVLLGDSGLRINGSDAHVDDTGLDLVTASLRVAAYGVVSAAGGAVEDCRRVGRACAFYGARTLHPDMRPWLDETTLARLHAESFAWSRARLPAAPEADLRALLDAGIDGQARFANNTSSPLCYAVLDGFEVPPALVRVFDRPRAAVRSIELYSDGYFARGATPSLADWEAAADEVERVDPEKIGAYPSVKGSSERMRTDDRTVLIVHPARAD